MAGKAVEILLKAKDFASAQIEKVKEHVRSIGDASDSSVAGNERLSSSFSKLTARLGAFIGATAGLIAVKGLLQGVFNTGSKFETLKTQLDAVTGSAEEGEKAFAWIKQFAKDTPLQLDEVAKSFVTLKAFGLDPLDGTFQKLVDQSAKLGGGQEKLNGIILGVGQAWAKQKLQGEEILQLVERGVPVWDLLSKALGKTAAEIQDMSAKGELGRDAIKALIDEMGSSSLGAAVAQMDDASGIVSNLKDQFTEFLSLIADSGTLDYFKSQLKELGNTIKAMSADGSLQRYAKNISDGIVSMAGIIKSAVGTVISFTSEIKNFAAAFVTVKLVQYGSGFLYLAKAITVAKTAQIALNLAMRANPIGILVTLLGGLYIAINKVVDKYFDWTTSADKAARAQQLAADQAEAATEKYASLTKELGLQITSEEDLKKAIDDGLVSLNAKTQQYELVATATEKATLAQYNYISSLTGVSNEINQQAITMVAAAAAGQQFKAIIDEMTASNKGLAGSLSSMSTGAFAEFRAAAQEALSGNFLTDLEKAELQVDLVAESLKRAGVDAETFKSGMSSAALEAVKNYQFLATQANVTGDILLSAIGGAIKSIGNQKDLDVITGDLAKMATTGKLTGEQVVSALAKIDAAAEKLVKPLQKVNDESKKAGDALREMLSGINSTDTVQALNDISAAASKAFDEGKISAEEYLAVMEKIDQKKAQLIATTQKQIDKEKELAKTAKESADEQLSSEKDANNERTRTFQISGKLGEATAKALELNNKARNSTLEGAAAIRRNFENVKALAESFVNASEQADKLAVSVLKTADSARATEAQMSGYVKTLEAAIAGGEQLNDQSLINLQSALSAAKSKMEELRGETRSAASEVAGLESELASLQGNQAKVQQLEYQQKRLDIEEKITKAQAEGNGAALSSYRQSLALLEQINVKKQATIRQDKQKNASDSTVNTRQQNAEKTVRMVFESPTGKQVSAVVEERDAQSLVEVIKQAGAVSR